MNPGLIVKLRPLGPWRIGPASGARDRVDLIYHSDTLFSAVTHAMRLLGKMEYWLEVTARRGEGSLVRFSSMFPSFGETLYVPPPRAAWPPPQSVRVRWSGARFVPLNVVNDIYDGKPPRDDRWSVDGPSECLVPSGKTGPFRIGVRSSAAVDRETGNAEPHSVACLEFAPRGGLWFAVQFADTIARDQWFDPLRASFRLLADSGFGGERSRGWGRSAAPEIREGNLPGLLLRNTLRPQGSTHQWLLSLTTPAATDAIDWDKGNYRVSARSGRVESMVNSGALKKHLNMLEEGSVVSAAILKGSASDVAPDGHPHPVYRAGFAFAITIPAELPRALEPEVAPTSTPEDSDAEQGEPEASHEPEAADEQEKSPSAGRTTDVPGTRAEERQTPPPGGSSRMGEDLFGGAHETSLAVEGSHEFAASKEPGASHDPETSHEPEHSDESEGSLESEALAAPEPSHASDASSKPELPHQPKTLDEPETSHEFEASNKPGAPHEPEVPSEPETSPAPEPIHDPGPAPEPIIEPKEHPTVPIDEITPPHPAPDPVEPQPPGPAPDGPEPPGGPIE